MVQIPFCMWSGGDVGGIVLNSHGPSIVFYIRMLLERMKDF